MSTRPKRNIRPPVRYEPEERPLDDYDDEFTNESLEEEEVRKRLKGEFDGFDDDEDDDDEDEGSEPNEYQVGDGFLVDDDEVDEPEDDEEEEEEFEETDDDDDDEDYDEDDEDDDDVLPAKIYESDVAH